MKGPRRTMTTLAVGMLALDAALLFIGGVQFNRPWLFAPAVLCAAGAVVVIVAWRRYRRMLTEIEVMLAARNAELLREAETIGDLPQPHTFQD